jgi:hypothetical protein
MQLPPNWYQNLVISQVCHFLFPCKLSIVVLVPSGRDTSRYYTMNTKQKHAMNLPTTRYRCANFCIPSFSPEQRREQNLLSIAIEERKPTSGMMSWKMRPCNGPGDSNGDGGKFGPPPSLIPDCIEEYIEDLQNCYLIEQII